jgi:hypothetical protein
MPAISFIQTIYVMVMNTVTDFYLMAIPIPIVWGSQLPWKKKVRLVIMFSGAFLEMTFGILRCVSILTVRPLKLVSFKILIQSFKYKINY